MARQMTKDMYDILMLDMPLRPAMMMDFDCPNGSDKHSALQRAVRAGATVEELDAALGNGEKISALVKKYANVEMTFKTAYDDIRENTEQAIKDLEAKEVLSETDKETLDILYEQMKDLQ